MDVEEEMGSQALRQVYLVTLPHPIQSHSDTGVPLVAPGSLHKNEVLRRFLAACASPIYVDGRFRQQGTAGVEVTQTGVWRELHRASADGVAHPHDHLPVLAAKQFRYLPVKRALLQRFGLASHWSCTHTGYWSPLRYLVMPSQKKPRSSLDREPALWAAQGPHPALDECCHEPLTAMALHKRRRMAEDKAAEAGEQGPKVTEMDIWPLVVRRNFRNSPDSQDAHLQLIAYAKKHCSAAVQAFLFKHRQRLPALLDDVWQWECVEDLLLASQQTRVGCLRAALARPCVCGGRWLDTVTGVLVANGLSVQEVCQDIRRALQEGRAETVPVVVFAGARGGEGKSLFLKGLVSVFGAEFAFPQPQKGNFPLLDLPNKKVAFLDDWRFDESVLPYAAQCLWYDGSALPIVRPQNQPGVVGHLLYRGTAPIFATTKLEDMERLARAGADDPRTGVPVDADAAMVYRRLKVHRFTVPMVKPASRMPYCPRCFAHLLFEQQNH